jgi:hypothetical protein
MHQFKRLCYGFVILLLGISLTGCLELNSHLVVHSAGDADLTVSMDTTRMDEMAKGFTNSGEKTTCASFLKDKEDIAQWKCEQLTPSKITSQRHYSKEEASSFMEISNGLLARHYKIKPLGVLGPLSKDGKKGDPAEGANTIAMLKGFGAVMTMEFDVPGKIVAIGNIKPAKSTNIQTIDLLDPLVWNEDYRVEAEDSKLELVLGMLVLALLVVVAGYAIKQRKTLPDGLRKAALPVSISIAILLMAFPWLWTGVSATTNQVADKSTPASKLIGAAPASASVAASEPVVVAPAPAPEEVIHAPPLESAHDAQGDRFVNQHPKDVMEADGLVAKFKQLLGNDYPDIIEAISVASPTSRDAGYIIGAGMAPHSGGSNTAMWAIDTQDGQIYAVWKQDNQIKVYGVANEKRLPATLYNWYKEMGGPN